MSYPVKTGAQHSFYLINHFGLYLPCVNIHIIQYVLHYNKNNYILLIIYRFINTCYNYETKVYDLKCVNTMS